jgi:uncharacterized membrane protein YhaH (DUF805 family)
MLRLFQFKGQIRQLPYALWSYGVFFSQHLVLFVVSDTRYEQLKADWLFYLLPLRSLVTIYRVSDMTLIIGLAYFLIAAWALAALAFRRTVDANVSEWIATCAIAPVVQIPTILFLCVMPSRVAPDRPPITDNVAAPGPAWAAAAQGVVAGMGLMLFAVAVGTLVFGTYGYGVFLLTPFIVGATTGYFANRKGDAGESRTWMMVAGATALGSIALVIAALEGLICIIMAAPLGLGAAWVGGLLGRSIALYSRRPPAQTLSCLALLPLVFAIESLLPPTASFETAQTITVKAPADVVWRSIVQMESIDEPLARPFRLGVAYPLGGEIIGEGVGALRRGEFSTGTAIERVTEWVPNRKLAFVVVKDVPAMRELSPYEHVHAPHVIGYFRTTSTSFELFQRSDGHTDILERTSHELRLDPVHYWLPMARLVVHENNARVLAHIRRHSERQRPSGE